MPRGRCVWVVLALALTARGEAQVREASTPAFDPAFVAAPPARSCLPYASGAIAHAAHVGSDLVAITHTRDPLLPSGYDGTDDLATLELRRTRDLGVVWTRVLDLPPTALAASGDAQRIAVGTYGATRVLDAGSARTIFEVAGGSFALAISAAGEVAISHGSLVDVVDAAGIPLRSVAISGDAADVIHAMRADGECDEIFTRSPSRALALAFARDGTLVASVSDGSVRALALDDARRWVRPSARDFGYQPTAVAIEAVSATTIRATYGDAFTVTLRTADMSETRSAATECTASERAIARRRLGATAEAEPITCAYVAGMDVDREGRHLWLAGITRVHAASGASLLVAPTLHTDAALLAGGEAWLFGVDGTGERWSLGAAGGRFAGALPIAGETGAVLDVSEDGRWVAIGTMERAAHGSEDERGYALRVVDTRTETTLAGIAAFGARARFVPGRSQIALETFSGARRTVEIRALPGGARVRRVTLADTEYGGLVAVDAGHLVVAEGPHVRVVALADGSERAIDLPPCVIEAASLHGDRLAMRAYDQTVSEMGHHRIELLDLGEPLRSLGRASGASGHDVAWIEDGAAAIYVGADGVVHRIDAASGAVTDVPGFPEGIVGVALTAHGMLFAQRATAGALLWLGGTRTETTLLDWTRAADHAGASIAYELGGRAYVVGHDGHTRGAIDAIDGGVVVRSVSGAFSVTPGARDALAVRDGDALLPCDASMETQHAPGLLEALLAP